MKAEGGKSVLRVNISEYLPDYTYIVIIIKTSRTLIMAKTKKELNFIY